MKEASSICSCDDKHAEDHFLDLPYAELQKRNLQIKKAGIAGKVNEIEKEMTAVIKKEEGVKAVTVCFSDLEGKLHMLDYNKAYFLTAYKNLTFDGSSIRGFSKQSDSDLRLHIDWCSFKWLPAKIFGRGKVMVFSSVVNQDGSPYEGDYRSNLLALSDELYKKKGYVVNVAPEIEGFVMEGENAEQNFDEREGFTLASKGGYFNALPKDRLRQFIDRLAETTRVLGFENEKDHPEVAPSQFETNYKYTNMLRAADQILIYKVAARQIAKSMGVTASFLPKPIVKINGSGMHSNISINKGGKNLFYNAKGEMNLSKMAHDFATGILYYANDLCLTINPSVNAYRRLDPVYEAPNQIKMSASDRGSMIRIPIGNEKSARVEVRTVAPDANPYLAYYLLVKAGMECMEAGKSEKEKMYKLYSRPVKKLPGDIYTAIQNFKRSNFIKKIMQPENAKKYIELKEVVADRCARALGTRVKMGEVRYHHEVTNQVLWNKF